MRPRVERARVPAVAFLLFGSGACALIYQVAWLRAMRLIFGASTAATAAVLAIFMGGLGIGGVLLGRRADRHPQPLALYARLELFIGLSAAATPALVWVARHVYVQLGGSVTLGSLGATVVRSLLAAVVLGTSTVLMGGTLPAAARAVETSGDAIRRSVAVLYGANTLGAVTGAWLSTFVLLETLGTRATLWLACAVNVAIAVAARMVARRLPARAAGVAPTTGATAASASAPAWFVLLAAAIVGCAFLLMELVWYRMLAPLLGGSSYTFGLILTVALFGVGVGGAGYAALPGRRSATLSQFALICTLEAACIALPYALGDRVAFLAYSLRALGADGFYWLVWGWTQVAALVVLPAAIVSGVQFPLLIALLGRGREEVGRHVGLAYAWNTGGAIVGSLTGGFGLLPVLTAPGVWQMVAIVLVALGGAALLLAGRIEGWRLRLLPGVVSGAAALLLLRQPGPTAAWRHSAIGAGRAAISDTSVNGRRDWANYARRAIAWEADGVESSVALDRANGLSFVINGKSDGNAKGDAPTQVMAGLIGTLLHPHPTRALVVGLGTGSTAGWMGAVPSLQRVDVVELEPAIVEVARACAAVNHDVLGNPNVHLVFGDAREVLLTTPERYDVIFSEPSNPYRAGIASLFTREFYQAVRARLADDGVFLQFVQAYEVDEQTIATIYATLTSVFPAVETWQTQPGDLFLMAARHPVTIDVPTVRARLRQEPYRSALAVAWHAEGLEGFLARYVANAALAPSLAGHPGALNTDDHTPIEFAFARTVGRQGLFDLDELRARARAQHVDRPSLAGGAVDWSTVEYQRVAGEMADAEKVDVASALSVWRAQPREPAGRVELAIIAEALADDADETALRFIEQLGRVEPTHADALLARLRWRQQRWDAAADALVRAFEQCQHDPWPMDRVLRGALAIAADVAAHDAGAARRLSRVLLVPFAAAILDDERRLTAVAIAAQLDQPDLCVDALATVEPYVPWKRDFLTTRLRCYQRARHPLAARARRDLDEFLRDAPAS